jgi:hypothetical protein
MAPFGGNFIRGGSGNRTRVGDEAQPLPRWPRLPLPTYRQENTGNLTRWTSPEERTVCSRSLFGALSVISYRATAALDVFSSWCLSVSEDPFSWLSRQPMGTLHSPDGVAHFGVRFLVVGSNDAINKFPIPGAGVLLQIHE